MKFRIIITWQHLPYHRSYSNPPIERQTCPKAHEEFSLEMEILDRLLSNPRLDVHWAIAKCLCLPHIPHCKLGMWWNLGPEVMINSYWRFVYEERFNEIGLELIVYDTALFQYHSPKGNSCFMQRWSHTLIWLFTKMCENIVRNIRKHLLYENKFIKIRLHSKTKQCSPVYMASQ